MIPIPDRDFDPTEVAVSWRVLTNNGHRVVFAIESAAPGVADDIMVGPAACWIFGPGCRCWVPFRSSEVMLRANRDGRRAYREMLRSDEYRVRIDPAPGRSVLYGRRTTALTWAMERRAWRLTRSRGSGIPTITAPTSRSLASRADLCRRRPRSRVPEESQPTFCDVGHTTEWAWLKNTGMVRDTVTDSRQVIVVDDDNHLSARWPGDTHTFANLLSQKLNAARLESTR